MWSSLVDKKLFAVIIIMISVRMSVNALVSTEIPFCSGRSQLVPVSSSYRLGLDGSHSTLKSVVSTIPQPGTSCTCRIIPTTDIRSVSVALVTDINRESCSKTLGIAVAPYYAHRVPACVDQTFTLDNVGSMTIEISLHFVNERVTIASDDLYKVWLGTTEDFWSRNETTTFKVSCLAPTITPLSTTSSSTSPTTSSSTSSPPSTTPSFSSTADPNQNFTNGETKLAEVQEGPTSSVVIVCVIVGTGLVLVILTLCLLCYIARRLDKSSGKQPRRSPRRIYRRICHTIRHLPENLNIRRPLPPTPESIAVKKFKNHSHVFVTESGPYDSINSSVKHPISMLRMLGGNMNHSGDKGDYEYLYPVNALDDSQNKATARTLSADCEYITPIRDTQRKNKVQTNRTAPEDELYVNTLPSANTDSQTVAMTTVVVDNNAECASAGGPSAEYIEMGLTKCQDRDGCINSQDSNIEVSCRTSDISTDENKTNSSKNAIDDQSAEDVYINLDTDTVITADVTNTDSSLKDDCDHSTKDIYIDMNVANIKRDNKDSETCVDGNIDHPALDTNETQDNIENEMTTKQKDNSENEVTAKQRDSGYMSIGAMEVLNSKQRQASSKDKTFPNLMKLNMASIKTMVASGTCKKRGPEVKPKPKRYLRNMEVSNMAEDR